MTDAPPIPDLPMPDWAALGAMPIADDGESLCPTSLGPERIRTYPAYFKMGIPGAIPECHLRQGVYERLLEAAGRLPAGIRLVVPDGWRPFVVQQYLFDTLMDILAKKHPRWSQAELLAQARELVAPPSCDDRSPSPHLTGGAVDVTLCDGQGRLLDMGTQFDEASPASYSAYFEALADSGERTRRVRDNRRLLYGAMTGAGFSNLPSEWWHYDYGDQLWAWFGGRTAARYGATRVYSLKSLWSVQLGEG